MKIRGSKIVVQALEAEGVRFTFGIPGTHNVELYDALENSKSIEPILVTDEQSGSFMADAVSRTSDSIGVLNVVPGAGVTHALSGIAEAFMDCIPLLVLCCAIRGDTGKAFQVHDIDQAALLKPITKAVLRPSKPSEIYPFIRRAVALARAGTPGPVAVEVPSEYYILTQDVPDLWYRDDLPPAPAPGADALREAAALLNAAKHPALYVGYGARRAPGLLVTLAEKLGAPVTTTIQGKGVFPEHHALWLWNNFGHSAPHFVRQIMDHCDCLLAIGCRFGEVATASYGLQPPENLIHVDINPEVFNRNYKARLTVPADATKFIDQLLPRLDDRGGHNQLAAEIRKGHAEVKGEWVQKSDKNRVSTAAFFAALQRHAHEDAIYATDSGNGTFLAMEHLRLKHPGCFIGPVDFSCMGYSVPAAIGAKFANPQRDVIALAGDGALLMTGLELITASSYKVAPAVFVLRDGELAQIVQLQRTSFNRDTCSVLGPYNLKDLAAAANCGYLKIERDGEISGLVEEAINRARQKEPVVVEVSIDYSQKTYFTKGVITTNFWRLPFAERLRMINRAAKRRLKIGD